MIDTQSPAFQPQHHQKKQSIYSTNMMLDQEQVNEDSCKRVFNFLSSLVDFKKFPSDVLKTFATYCRFATINPGQYIVIEGDERSINGFIVVSGRLAMIKTSINGKELIVELLPANDIFGLLVTLSHEKLPEELSARAHSKSEVLWVPIRSLISLLNSNPGIYRDFLEHLLVCLQSSYRISRGLAHDRVEVRIAAILTSLAIKFARVSPNTPNYTIDITRQQLADLSGTTVESAIRVTRTMHKDGLIDLHQPGVIRIIKLLALQELSES